MASAADIGVEASNYHGDPNLGGGTFGVVNLDTKPLEQLATYTVLYNKSVWEQRQKDVDAKIAEIAKLSEINPNLLHGKDKDELIKRIADVHKYAADYAAQDVPTDPKEKIKQTLEWQDKLAGLDNVYTTGKQRSLAYATRNGVIDQSTDAAAVKAAKRKQLEDSFNNSDITTPLSGLPDYKLETFDVPKFQTQTVNTIGVMGNDNYDVENSFYNPKLNGAIADQTILNLKRAYPQKGTPEYDKLSPDEKMEAEQQAGIESDGKIWQDAIEPLNAALMKTDAAGNPLYVDADGRFLAQKFENDFSSNSPVINAYNALKRFNAYHRDKYNQAISGLFNDKGLSYKLPSTLDPNDFKAGFIDFTKGINSNQLLQSGMFAKYTGDVTKKTLAHTGEAGQMSRAAMENDRAIKIAEIQHKNDIEGRKISAGWTADKDGNITVPPVKNALTQNGNGGLVPFWQNRILPQITSKNFLVGKGNKFRYSDKEYKGDYTGDVEIKKGSTALSGLDIIAANTLDTNGKPMGIDDQSTIYVRYEKGQPVGVVINGIFMSKEEVDSKATQAQDKAVNNKFDSPILQQGQTPAGTTTGAGGGMTPDQLKDYMLRAQNAQ